MMRAVDTVVERVFITKGTSSILVRIFDPIIPSVIAFREARATVHSPLRIV